MQQTLSLPGAAPQAGDDETVAWRHITSATATIAGVGPCAVRAFAIEAFHRRCFPHGVLRARRAAQFVSVLPDADATQGQTGRKRLAKLQPGRRPGTPRNTAALEEHAPCA